MSSYILDLVELEIARQQRLKSEGKFAETAEDKMARGDVAGAFAVLTEEVGEVARAINENETCSALRAELVQVAAVAVSAIKGLDRACVHKASAI